MYCILERKQQFHFCAKGKCERRKICSLIRHGGSAGSEIKSFPRSSAPENSGRAGLREGGRSVKRMMYVCGIKINSLSVCLSSLFLLYIFYFLKSSLKLGRVVFRPRINCCRGWGEKIPPVRTLRKKQLLRSCLNYKPESHSSCIQQWFTLHEPKLTLHLGGGFYQLCFLGLLFEICCTKGKARISLVVPCSPIFFCLRFAGVCKVLMQWHSCSPQCWQLQ